MDIPAFRAGLAAAGIGPGATWMKADFHVHMPGSGDYEYKGVDAYQKLAAAINAEQISFAVVLKHQEFPSRTELTQLQKLCPNSCLIPGAEINVIVDALSKKIGKDYFFHCILAVDPKGDDDGTYLLRKAKEEFTYRDDGTKTVGFSSSILDLGRFFREHRALFIPAHLHQSKAPEVSRSIDDLYDDDAFLGFVADKAFDALEVRDLKTAQFFDGTKSTTEGRRIPSSVCVASSDAHHHDHLAQRGRGTWVRCEQRTFGELAAALTFPHRVSLTPLTTTYARILGVHVKGSFIPDMWISLSESLNALIGSKGSGKTALLECLRFVLDTPIPKERQEEVKRHRAHILGSSGYVECLVVYEDATELLVSRRADSPDRITTTDVAGTVATHVAGSDPVFPSSILGWHEIEGVADDPAARIGLLDRVGDPTIIRGFHEQIDAQVERAKDLLPLLQRPIRKLDGMLHDLWDLQRKRLTLARLKQAELSALQEQYEWFLLTEQRLQSLKAGVIKRRGAVPDLAASHLAADVAAPPPLAGTIATSLEGVTKALADNVLSEQAGSAALQASLIGVEQAVDAALTDLVGSFATFREATYTPTVNALAQEDRDVLTKQIQVLEETKRLPVVEAQCSELLREVQTLAQQLLELCDGVGNTRDRIVQIREALVASLNTELPSVRLTFQRSANHSSRDRFQSRHGADAIALLGYVQGFGSADAYENLKILFRKLVNLDLTTEHWDVKEALWDVKFIDFLHVIDDDDVQLALDVGKAGFVPLQNLSAGQRCVAVFPLLLRNTRGPLVIDQPEDNLDNRFIADAIAPDLQIQKRRQQFLVTSHNANLVVLTDADLIAHMDSDGATCSFRETGFLACPDSHVKKSVLDVLDGGEAALLARQNKYGIGLRT